MTLRPKTVSPNAGGSRRTEVLAETEVIAVFLLVVFVGLVLAMILRSPR